MPKTAAASKRDEILAASESLIRKVGFNGFSTRDVADAVGIKAASVHYHFPMKSDIGVAVTERYTLRFLEDLGDPVARDRRPPPQSSKRGSLGPRLGRQLHEFRVARGEWREIEAVGFDDALLAGGHLKRSRRRRIRRSWQEKFGLLLGLVWACTGLFIISLFYRQDVIGK